MKKRTTTLIISLCAASLSAGAQTYYYWGDGVDGEMPIFESSAWSSSGSEYVAIPEGTNVNSPDANWVFDYDAHLPLSPRNEGIYLKINQSFLNINSLSFLNFNYGTTSTGGETRTLFISDSSNASWNIGEFTFAGGITNRIIMFGVGINSEKQTEITFGTVNIGNNESNAYIDFGGDAAGICTATVGDKTGQNVSIGDVAAIKYLTVTGDFNIIGNSIVNLNVYNEDTSAVHSENAPDIVIDGVVRMTPSTSPDNNLPTLNLLNRVNIVTWHADKPAPGATNTFIKIGGLDGRGNLSNNSQTLDASTVKLIFTNKEDCDFSGTFTENRSDSIKTVMSVKMAGENGKKQIIRADSAFTGTVEVESGTLIMHSTSALGKLTMTGGGFGGIEGGVVVSGAEWLGGDIVFHNTETFFGGLADKITVEGTFTKSAEGKIGVDFSGLDAASLIEEGNNVFDLITANAFEGSFSSDANDDFEAKNLLNAIADFAWTGNTLTVTFSQVPEPATIAALFGAIALGLAAWRRRK